MLRVPHVSLLRHGFLLIERFVIPTEVLACGENEVEGPAVFKFSANAEYDYAEFYSPVSICALCSESE
jgi:hypothetical protein